MGKSSSKLLEYMLFGVPLGFVVASGWSSLSTAQQRGPDPIAYVGHGAMFNAKGNQIHPTAAFIARAQAWYRAELLAAIDPQQRSAFTAFERELKKGLRLEGQAALVVEQRAIDWLFANSKWRDDDRFGSKLSAIRYQLTWNLPVEARPGAKKRMGIWEGGPFALDPAIKRKLGSKQFDPGGGVVFLATTNLGELYNQECRDAQVPVPPPINEMDQASGTMGWKVQGMIPQTQQFIEQTPAEVRTFSSPEGMCIALPRYSSASMTTVALDGVICISRITSKVCIWDNQMGGTTFPFPATQKIPIGAPDLTVDPAGRYQGGGFELTAPNAGICTDCHAGENPFIVHPNTSLGTGITFGDLRTTLPMFAPNRYIPLVRASWPQNDASHAGPYVPGACGGCHQKPATSFATAAGRFPHLSNRLPGYCRTILRGAVQGLSTASGDMVNAPATMPTASPGSLATDAVVSNWRNKCNMAPDSDTADYGDPHLTTVNGTNYDFQAAGEFTALRNSDSGFELQTRQTPVVTNFVPGTNPYTGLQSCVSLNTAAALRLGKRRVSYQPGEGERMEVRVDGKRVSLPAGGIDLGGGNRIASAAVGGGIEARAADGSRVVITPNFWSSQGYWYLNIDVLDTPAQEGTMGYIRPGDFLPLAPSGLSFGPMPAGIPARWTLLNQKFAGAWRVTNANSLFDYAAGTSPASFADPGWPPKPGMACSGAPAVPSIPGPGRPPIRPLDKQKAAEACRPVIKDSAAHAACLFDAVVMGDAAVGEAYRRSLAARAAAAAAP